MFDISYLDGFTYLQLLYARRSIANALLPTVMLIVAEPNVITLSDNSPQESGFLFFKIKDYKSVAISFLIP